MIADPKQTARFDSVVVGADQFHARIGHDSAAQRLREQLEQIGRFFAFDLELVFKVGDLIGRHDAFDGRFHVLDRTTGEVLRLEASPGPARSPACPGVDQHVPHAVSGRQAVHDRLVFGDRRPARPADQLDHRQHMLRDVVGHGDHGVERRRLRVVQFEPVLVQPLQQRPSVGSLGNLPVRPPVNLGVRAFLHVVQVRDGSFNERLVNRQAVLVDVLVDLPQFLFQRDQIEQGVREGFFCQNVRLAVCEQAQELFARAPPFARVVLRRLARLAELHHQLVALLVLLDREPHDDTGFL